MAQPVAAPPTKLDGENVIPKAQEIGEPNSFKFSCDNSTPLHK